MDSKPCPNCGAPKHPLKACSECGRSNLRQERQERLLVKPPQIPNDPRLFKYGAGYQVRNRVMQEYLYDVWQDDNEIHPYQSAFDEDLPGFDISTIPVSQSTHTHDSPELPSHSSPLKLAHLKFAVKSQNASFWLAEKPAAQIPMKKVWDISVFDGWPCPATMKFALDFVKDNPKASLRDLQLEIINRVMKNTLPHPHLWRIGAGITRLKPLYRDAVGRLYIDLDGDLHLAHSIRHLGGLVGGKGFRNFRDGVVPAKGYFVCWESEDQARNFSVNQKLSKLEAQAND